MALSQEQQLLDFMEHEKTYQKYYDDMLILLKIGLHISELCGPTVRNLDFKKHTIYIDHRLLRNAEVRYYIETPKTKSGIRNVSMSDEVGKSLKRVLTRKQKAELIVIDGHSCFLFL